VGGGPGERSSPAPPPPPTKSLYRGVGVGGVGEGAKGLKDPGPLPHHQTFQDSSSWAVGPPVKDEK